MTYRYFKTAFKTQLKRQGHPWIVGKHNDHLIRSTYDEGRTVIGAVNLFLRLLHSEIENQEQRITAKAEGTP